MECKCCKEKSLSEDFKYKKKIFGFYPFGKQIKCPDCNRSHFIIFVLGNSKYIHFCMVSPKIKPILLNENFLKYY